MGGPLIPSFSPVPGEPQALRSQSTNSPGRIFEWAQPPSNYDPRQLHGASTTDGDSLHPSALLSSSRRGAAPGNSSVHLKMTEGGTKRKRGDGRKYFCGRCNKDGQNHKWENCPQWRLCLYCDKKGHWSHDCRHPHSRRCTETRCRVNPDHQNYGRGCPQRAQEMVPLSGTYWEEDYATEMDAGESMWDDIDWEAMDRGD
jgi:hypothetical protein